MRALAVAVLACVAAFAAPGMASGAVSCHSINAKGVGQDNGDLTTTATITGGGLLHGTTAAAFALTGFSGTVASFEGTIVFTVNRGTLTGTLTGTLDLATGEFSAVTSSVAGTGKLAGATGSLVLSGIEDLSDGSFTETVVGEICVDLAP